VRQPLAAELLEGREAERKVVRPGRALLNAKETYRTPALIDSRVGAERDRMKKKRENPVTTDDGPDVKGRHHWKLPRRPPTVG
jgi:hypothetical protein